MDVLKKLKQYIKPTLATILIFCSLIVVSQLFVTYKKGLWEKDIRVAMSDMLSGKKSALEKALYSRIYYTRGIAAYVSLNPLISSSYNFV